MPKLVRLYIRHVAIGALLSVVFVSLLLWLNVANLWHLVSSTADGPLAVFLLVVFNAIVFSGVQFSVAVMRLAEKNEGDDGGRSTTIPLAAAQPCHIPVSQPRSSGSRFSA